MKRNRKGRSNRKGQLIDFTLVTNPIGPSKQARHAMRKALRTSDVRPDPHAQFLAGHLCERLDITPARLLLGHGSSHLLSIFVQVTRPKSMLISSPFPAYYGELLERWGVEIIHVPLKKEHGFALDVEPFKQLWKDADAALILNPHDPTGMVVDKASLVELIETSNRLGKPLIIDETLIEFTELSSPVEEVVSAGQVLILRSFSFYHALAGLRVGYAVGNAALIEKMGNIIDPWPVNSVAAAAALVSLRDKGFPGRTRQFLAAEQAYLAKKFAQLRGIECFSLPWGCLIRFEPVIANLAERLLEKSIVAETYVDGDGNQYIRFPFRSHRLNAWFARRLGWVLKEQRDAHQ